MYSPRWRGQPALLASPDERSIQPGALRIRSEQDATPAERAMPAAGRPVDFDQDVVLEVQEAWTMKILAWHIRLILATVAVSLLLAGGALASGTGHGLTGQRAAEQFDRQVALLTASYIECHDDAECCTHVMGACCYSSAGVTAVIPVVNFADARPLWALGALADRQALQPRVGRRPPRFA